MASVEGGSVVKLAVAGLAPGITEKQVKCYFSVGVDEDLEVISISLLKTGNAVVKVSGLKDVDDFCTRTHKIKDKIVEISQFSHVKKDETPVKKKKIGQDTVEVVCSEDVDTDMVECYFQGPKSGGGRDKIVESIKSVGKGVYHVKFESEEDAAAVVSRDSHAVMKKTLSVRLLLPTPQKMEYEPNKLLIRNIPEPVDEELLNAYLEGRFHLNISSDFSVDVKGSSVLVTFAKQYSDEELESMYQSVKKKNLRGRSLSVHHCQVNSSIMISSIEKDTFKCQDGLELYFESKRSGGGEDMVESVVMVGADRARVTFKDSTVVARVLAKKHSKLGPNVSVTPCTPLDKEAEASELPSGSNSTNTEMEKKEEEDPKEPAPSPSAKAEPIVLPLDPLIAKYLHHESEVLQGMSKEVHMSAVVDSVHGTVKLFPDKTSPPDSLEVNVKQFQYLLSEVVCKVDIQIPSEAASSVYPLVMQRCSQDNLQQSLVDNKVSVAGKTKAVVDLHTNVQEVCRRMIQTSEEFRLSPEEYAFFTRCQLQQIEQKHQGIKLEYSEVNATVSASGSVHDVAQFKENFAVCIAHGKVPVDIPPLAVEFLQTGRGSGILETLVGNVGVVPLFVPCQPVGQTHTLKILYAHDNAQKAEAVAVEICSKIALKKFEFPPYFYAHVAGTQKFSDFKDDASKKYAYLSAVEDNCFSLACRRDILLKVSQMFEKFVTEECSTTEKVLLKRGVWRLLHSPVMEKKWSEFVGIMKERAVNIVSSSKSVARNPFVMIKGEHEAVAAMKSKLLELQSSVKEEQINLARPGIVQYFFKDPNGQVVLKGVETEARVCIEPEVKEDEPRFRDKDTSFHTTPDFTKVCFANTKDGRTINVYVGDITLFNKAEVIVNAANEDLEHVGGVALAIAERGGPIISQDSREHVRKRGKVDTGSAVIFHKVGKLPQPYKAIVHAVGPRWDSFDKDKSKALLRKTVRKSLSVSQDYTSIAIPAISSGVFGFSPDVCAESLVKGVVEYFDTNIECKITDVNFVIFKDNIDVFMNALRAHFENVRTIGDTPATTPVKAQGNSPKETRRGRRRGGSSKPTLSSPDIVPQGKYSSKLPAFQCIKITKGDILKHQEDVLVNTTDQQLGFGGFVGTLLLNAAGPGLSNECQAVAKPVATGNVVTTGAHNLKSKHIVHVVLPGYNGAQSEAILRSVARKCLQECTRLKAKSISIPSIGAGNLHYPESAVAQCLLEETVDYLTKNEGKTSLQLVHFVIFDPKVHQAFQAHYSQMSKPNSSTVKSETPAKLQPIRYPAKIVSHSGNSARSRPSYSSSKSNDDSCSFSLPNGLMLQVVQGDITDEKVEVIVNPTNPELQLVGGGVAGALLKKGGHGLQSACDTLRAQGIKGAEGKVVETMCEGMGQLQCKSIFHVVFEGKDPKKLVKTILKCLDRAEKMKYTSIAFPAIGTGTVSYPPAQSADGIVKALKEFTQRKPKHVKVIRMVIFLPHIYQQFTEAFKKIGESSDTYLTYLYDKGTKFFQSVGSFFTPNDDFGSVGEAMVVDQPGSDDEAMEVDQPTSYREVSDEEDDWEDLGLIQSVLASATLDSEVTLCVYGETDQSVKRAEKRLRAIIETHFITEEVENPNITMLPESEIADLKQIAKKHSVDIDIDCDPDIHTIKLHGCQGDVLKVKDKVRDVLSEMNQLKAREEVAIVVFKHVKWVRQYSEEEEDYSEMLSYEIEQAYQQNNKGFYKSTSAKENFTINFSKMEDTDVDSGDVCRVQRIDFSEVEKPPDWVAMPKDSQGREVHSHLVVLKPGCPEFNDELKKYDATMKGSYNQIVSIERLQNPVLYGQYTARKKEMEKRNPTGCKNEQWVFHGTSPDTINHINTQGFNRSFKGKNGVVYGQGVYFARDASYSNRYANPDATGHRYMYLTRVLTGEYTTGHSTMIVPPAKNPQVNPYVLFDSTVDNQASPTIFVVYTDSQSYPAYLIKYT